MDQNAYNMQQQPQQMQQMQQMQQPQKSNAGLIAGMVVCLLLAVGGVGFGIFSTVNGGSSTKASDYKFNLVDKDGKTTELKTDTIEISENDKTITIKDQNGVKVNPVIMSTDDTTLRITASSSVFHNMADSKNYMFQVEIENGKISKCYIGEAAYIHGWGWAKGNETNQSTCTMENISGNISKVAYAAFGHAADAGAMVFMLEDGTAQTFSYTNDENIKTAVTDKKIKTTKLSYDGYITDIINVHESEPNGVGGGAGSVIYFSDGTYKRITSLEQ